MQIDKNILDKWQSLLATLTVSQKSDLICSEAQIAQAEAELNFKFPAGYAEYSRVFGSGSLGQDAATNFFRIYCPCHPTSYADIRQTGCCLVGLKLDLDTWEPNANKEIEIANGLLENGYPFADSDRADSFFWDLTTYSEVDRSYDIYWIPDETPEELRLIGRDFFEFVS